MDTDSLYLALVDENLEECILLEKKFQCTQIRRNDRRDVFIANEKQNFSHLHAALFIKSMINENQDYSKKNFAKLKCCACAARRVAAMIVRVRSCNS